tara:strand:+ start:14266 stop:15672 length:1407 start_codon:yes stop_codon:yes gene_type:complete
MVYRIINKLTLSITAALFLIFLQGNAQSENRPNIIILFADDLGYRDLSCYGSLQTVTPVLDKMASEGIRFTDFYAGSAVCSPSRASLLTGRSSLRAGFYSWIHPTQKMHLRREEITIAELLKNNGYATAHIGKWHLSYDLVKGSGPQPNPKDQGFDYWMATDNNAYPSHANPENFIRNGTRVGTTKGYSSQLIVDEAIRWLDNSMDRTQPFYLNLWFHEPHKPFASPPEIRQRHLNTSNPDYYGSIESMDQAIGKLFVKLKEINEMDNTLIIFMSDNGSLMRRQGSNGELKEGKASIWEGGIRVPGIIKWTGKVRPGTIEHTPVGVVDVLPTLCDITETELPKDRIIDGVSLLPLINGDDLTRDKPLYWFYASSRPIVSIRDGDLSLVANPELDIPQDNLFNEEWIGLVKTSRLTHFRLFNLINDPGQNFELKASDYPEDFESMKMKLIQLHGEIVNEALDWRKFEWD